MPQAIYFHSFHLFRHSPLVLSKLSDATFRYYRSLGIVSPPTRRGTRGGKSAKRNDAARKFLLCGHVNARFLNSTKYVIKQHITTTNLDVLAITEAALSRDDGDEVLRMACPKGYSAINFPRPNGRRGGGIAIIYRDSVRVSPVNITFSSRAFEHSAVSLTVYSASFYLITVYRPPSLSTDLFLSDFSSYLELLAASTSKVMIVGDFNIHIDDHNNYVGRNFLSLLESFDLTQNVVGPTHDGGRGQKRHTLDLVITRLSDKLLSDCVVSDYLTDHAAIHCLVRMKRPPRPLKTVEFRKLKAIDVEHFSRDLAGLPLCVSPSDDIDAFLSQYNSGLVSVLDKHAPIIRKTVSIRPDNPWCTDEIRLAKRRLRKQEKKWRRTELEIDKQIFKDLRDGVNLMCDKAKESFLNRQITENTGKRSLYKLIDSFLLPKPGLRLPRHDSLQSLVDRFGNYFTEKINTIRANLDAAAPTWTPVHSTSLSSFFEFSLVTVPEIISLINLCPTKSSPRDPIPTFLLKEVAVTLAPSITQLLNLSFSTGIFPEEMKLAFVTPLLKKPGLDPETVDNYRPISNLSFFSKLLERAASLQLVKYLETNLLFVPVQSAYRSNHSTETALLKVLNDILRSIDNGEAVVLALLDQSAAFDTVDHEILLHRLSATFGIKGTALVWISSYLSNRLQSVSVSGITSTPLVIPCGVPQGSVLGPILYILYNSPLHSIAASHGILDHLYADDDQQYKSFRVTPDGAEQTLAFNSLSASIGESRQWAATNRLKFNDGKTDAMIASSCYSRIKPAPIPLMVGDTLIFPSPTVRNLGVTFDSHLSFDAQIRGVCKTSFYHIRRIARIKKFLSRPSIILLIYSFVFSHLDYCNSLLIGLPSSGIDKLQRVQNCAARLVTGARKCDPITPHLKALHWLPVRQRTEFKVSLFMFRCLNNCAPSYLTSLLSFYHPVRSSGRSAPVLRSESSAHLAVPRSRTKMYGDRAFSVCGPRIWNALPEYVRLSGSLPQFKSRLKTHYYRLAYDDC